MSVSLISCTAKIEKQYRKASKVTRLSKSLLKRMPKGAFQKKEGAPSPPPPAAKQKHRQMGREALGKVSIGRKCQESGGSSRPTFRLSSRIQTGDYRDGKPTSRGMRFPEPHNVKTA